MIEVVPAGEAEVYDIEVEGTHNFVANGLITLNTRWHEDDFVGRLLSKDHEGDPGEWEAIRLPALADDPSDVLGRSLGEPLLSPLLPQETPALAVERWEEMRRSVGSYAFACTPAESPVLMADWTLRPISEVRPGDRVVGFEKGVPESRARLIVSTVERVTRYAAAPVQRMVLESGCVVRCTPDHRWYTGRRSSASEPGRRTYAPASVGTPLLRFAPDLPALTPARQRDLDWIAGMLDGEGHFRSNVVTITQSSTANPDVYARLRQVLDRLGWDYREELREPQYANSFRLRDTKTVIHELLERTFLGKRDRAVAAQWSSPRKPTRRRDRVVSIEADGIEAVYALQTSTGNYVVQGYASSNSMHQQRPAPAKGAIFNSEWWRFWTTDPERVTTDGRVVLLDPGRLAVARWLDSWDCSFKGADDSDFVVGQRWCRIGEDRLLIAQQRGRWTFTQTIERMEQWADRGASSDPALSSLLNPFGRYVHQRLIEDAANGAAILDVLKDRIPGMSGVRKSVGKEMYARAVTPEVEAGHVYLPHPGDPGNEWVTDLLGELRNFPHDAHDDQVDALTQALLALKDTGRGSVTVPGGSGRQIVRDVAAAARTDLARRSASSSGVRR